MTRVTDVSYLAIEPLGIGIGERWVVRYCKSNCEKFCNSAIRYSDLVYTMPSGDCILTMFAGS